jgi:O-antigen/teichoic acid export membrane protein
LLSVASFASLGLKYLDSIMIAKYLPLAQVGIYTIAVFIPTVIEAPLNSLEKIAAST